MNAGRLGASCNEAPGQFSRRRTMFLIFGFDWMDIIKKWFPGGSGYDD